jgi:spermidine/putrescine transport system ATP-binding protein
LSLSSAELAPGGGSLRVEAARKLFRTPEGGTVAALDGVSLAIGSNEFLTLLGPSGCGKTTLLKAIAGFEDLDEGEIYLDGRPLGGVPAYRRPFNTVFQSYALFPHMSVAGNIGYGPTVAGVGREDRAARVEEALRLVGLVGLERRMPRQLSGGQQQRVALARALVNRPRVLLLDEPLSALDRKLRQSMQLELKGLQHTVGVTFLFVTHDQEEALAMSDRIAVMEAGRILQLGTPTEVYDKPANRFVAGFVGAGNLFGGRYARAAGRARVETDTGLVLTVDPAGFADGDRVDILLRPEHLALAEPESGSPSLAVELEEVVFVGSDLQLHARLRDGARVTALHRHGHADRVADLRPGRTVTLAYAPSSPHLMASEG